MPTLYPQLTSENPSLFAEKDHPYTFITEKHLQILWAEKKLSSHLKIFGGESIEIIATGTWNTKAGPDFLQAYIRIGKWEYRGDVEIHLCDDGWYQHGHHTDARYNQVILHVSLWHEPRKASINKENGQQSYVAYIDQSIPLSLDQLFATIDVDLYPTKQFENQGRCSQSLFQILPRQEIKDLFRSAAYWRLEKKLVSLKNNCCEYPSFSFVSGIAMALGYRHNAKAFLDLFLYLIPYRDVPREELLAIALGCSGFLEDGRKLSWESSFYYQHLRKLWCAVKNQITHQVTLRLDNIRPLHHPIRRLVYLTYLLQDPRLEQLWPYHLQLWEKYTSSPSEDCKNLQHDFLDIIPNYHDPYWDYHFTFEAKSQPKPLASIGKDLKMHILLNATLPLLYERLKEQREVRQLQKFEKFYASLRVSHTSKSHYLKQRFFSLHSDEKMLEEAQMVQGAYQIHQDFCIHFESSCEGCPFVNRYTAVNLKR